MNPNDELICAIVDEDLDEVKKWIGAGADVNHRISATGYSPLHCAAESGLCGISALLLEKGAMVDARADDGETPLLLAVLNESHDVAQLLVSNGADINAADSEGYTSMFYAPQVAGMEEVLRGTAAGRPSVPRAAKEDSASANASRAQLLCQRCGKKILRTDHFYAKCEEAGFVVDPASGEVKARLGGFSMMGNVLDASAAIGGQRRSQQEMLQEIENQRGFRCTGCGRVYCMVCLFNHAPPHPHGGKACPKCGSTFDTWV